MRFQLEAIQEACLTPSSNRRDVDVQKISGGAGGIAAIASLPGRTDAGSGGTRGDDLVGVTDPMNFSGSEGFTQAGHKTFLVENGCNLLIRQIGGQGTDAVDHDGRGATELIGLGTAGNLARRDGTGLPADLEVNGGFGSSEGDILDQETEQLFLLDMRSGRSLPDGG